MLDTERDPYGADGHKPLTLSHRVENLALVDFNGDSLLDLTATNRLGEL